MVFYLIALVILVSFSGFFSMSEIALSSVNVLKLKKASENGDKMAARALKNKENINQTVYSIVFGNDFVNIFSTSIATIIGNIIFANLTGEYRSLLITLIMFIIILTI